MSGWAGTLYGEFLGGGDEATDEFTGTENTATGWLSIDYAESLTGGGEATDDFETGWP
jgi:hypothetical protein